MKRGYCCCDLDASLSPRFAVAAAAAAEDGKGAKGRGFFVFFLPGFAWGGVVLSLLYLALVMAHVRVDASFEA